jgi:NADH dehydrogenase
VRTTVVDAVTGAFSYSGAAIAAELKARGRTVRTLTAHPRPPSPGDPASSNHRPDEVRPLDFRNPSQLRESLEGVDTLFNTYWVRFPSAGTSFAGAIENSARLFDAAVDAGVRRVVHLSITHADPHSPYPYFAGKGLVETYLSKLPLTYAVLRPAILFGGRAVLVNNIAWLLRHLPVFAVGDGGRYRVRGIHIDDLARLCADEADSGANVLRDAVGPERPTFRELVDHLRVATGSRALVVDIPGALVPVCGAALNLALRDNVLTRDEYRAMADGLADSESPSAGEQSITEWVTQNASWLGRTYLNDTKNRT